MDSHKQSNSEVVAGLSMRDRCSLYRPKQILSSKA